MIHFQGIPSKVIPLEPRLWTTSRELLAFVPDTVAGIHLPYKPVNGTTAVVSDVDIMTYIENKENQFDLLIQIVLMSQRTQPEPGWYGIKPLTTRVGVCALVDSYSQAHWYIRPEFLVVFQTTAPILK